MTTIAWVLLWVLFAATTCLVAQSRLHRRRVARLRAEHDAAMVRSLEPTHDGAVLAADWERRFWEIHGVVERVLKERDVWKTMWRTEVSEHLEGQAVLEGKVVKMRLHLVRAIAGLNRLRLEADPKAALITSPEQLDPIDGPPVGQAERYFERMKELLTTTAPRAFDALGAAQAIADRARLTHFNAEPSDPESDDAAEPDPNDPGERITAVPALSTGRGAIE